MIFFNIEDKRNLQLKLQNGDSFQIKDHQFNYQEEKKYFYISFYYEPVLNQNLFNVPVDKFIEFNKEVSEYVIESLPFPIEMNHLLIKDLDIVIDLKKINSEYSMIVSIYHLSEHDGKWNNRWNPKTVVKNLFEALSNDKKLDIRYDDQYADTFEVKIIKSLNKDSSLLKELKVIAKKFTEAADKTLSYLLQIQWRKQFEKDEKLFTTELVIPLLRKMGFIAIHYNHGIREYGKDITFSKLDEFGLIRHYAVQVKSGNVSGKVKGNVEEIIGQIEDAFAMPYYDLGIKEARYISTFIIVISGAFSQNSKEKIANKIHKGLIGSVYFIDKEKILELIEKYWK